MNEVNISKAANFAAIGASSTGASDSQQVKSGKSLPGSEVKVQEEQAKESPKLSVEELETEVDQVNSFVQSIQRDLEFTVDKELDRTVVKVTDAESGEIIRQIPEDIFLELARRLKDDGELQLVNTLG